MNPVFTKWTVFVVNVVLFSVFNSSCFDLTLNNPNVFCFERRHFSMIFTHTIVFYLAYVINLTNRNKRPWGIIKCQGLVIDMENLVFILAH